MSGTVPVRHAGGQIQHLPPVRVYPDRYRYIHQGSGQLGVSVSIHCSPAKCTHAWRLYHGLLHAARGQRLPMHGVHACMRPQAWRARRSNLTLVLRPQGRQFHQLNPPPQGRPFQHQLRLELMQLSQVTPHEARCIRFDFLDFFAHS